MKKVLLLACIFTCLIASAQKFTTAFDQLLYVNEQWLNQKDADPALKYTPARHLSEHGLIQFHLQETEKLLLKRKTASLPGMQKQQRMNNLKTLHAYWTQGVFPVNDGHENRQPYFIDEFNNYCAVGYLMQYSGGDAIARDIHKTSNVSYLLDIGQPQMMDWVKSSGLTLDELALIQPGYPGNWVTAIMEMHYNNAGTDVKEYIEVHESTLKLAGAPGLDKALFYDGNGQLYKTLLNTDMQTLANGVGYYYNFAGVDSFADAGKIVLLGDKLFSEGDTLSITTYNDTAVDVHDFYFSNFVAQRHFSVGENENTPVGTSLTYCGFYSDANWSLQSMSATPGFPNSCTILPAALGDFHYSLAGKKVILNWQTYNENNVASFAIERSSNGIDFSRIGEQKAIGNGTSTRKYMFTDNSPAFINHYRIKQVDSDGKFVFSKILYVKVTSANPLQVLQPFVANKLVISVNLPQAEIASLTLYDFSGRLIRHVKALSGRQVLHLPLLASGNYLLQLIAKDGRAYNQQVVN